MLWDKSTPSFSLPEWMIFPAHYVDQWWLAFVSRQPLSDRVYSVVQSISESWQGLGFGYIDQILSHGENTLIVPLQSSLTRRITLTDVLSPAVWDQLQRVFGGDVSLPSRSNSDLDLLPGFTVDIRLPDTIHVSSGTESWQIPAWWRPLLPAELRIAPSMEARSIFEAARWMGIRRLNIIGLSPPLAAPPPGLVYLTDTERSSSLMPGYPGSGVSPVGESGQYPSWESHGWLSSPATIPFHLRSLDQWVVWGVSFRENSAKPAKIPVQPRTFIWDAKARSWRPQLFFTSGGGTGAGRMMCARSNQETTWGTFNEALEFLLTYPEAIIRRPASELRDDGRPVYVSETIPLRGLQFALRHSNQLLGIDIDHCVKDGQLVPEIHEIVQSLPGYWEYSPSLTGLRGFFIRPMGLEIPSSREFSGIEIYDGTSARFLTVTGQHLGTPEIGELSPDGWNWAVRHLRQHFGRSSRTTMVAVPSGEWNRSLDSGYSPSNQRGLMVSAHNPELRQLHLLSSQHPCPDDVLLEHIRQSPRHGARFQFYFNLWDIHPPDTFPPGLEPRPSWVRGDRSSGDSQMIFILTLYTQDPVQIDRIMRASPRMRPKWDRYIRHGGETYGEYVIGYNLGLRGITLPFGFLESCRPATQSVSPAGFPTGSFADAESSTVPSAGDGPDDLNRTDLSYINRAPSPSGAVPHGSGGPEGGFHLSLRRN